MKYGYLKKILCISITAAILTEGGVTLAAEDFSSGNGELSFDLESGSGEGGLTEDFTPDPDTDYGSEDIIEEDDDGELIIDEDDVIDDVTPTPAPSDDSHITPSPDNPTPVPDVPDVSPAPEDEELIEPDDNDNTDDELEEEDEELEDEDTEEEDDAVKDLIDRIEAFRGAEITEADREEIESIREAYDALSDEDKAKITNYDLLLEIEKKLSELELDDGELIVDDELDVTAVEGAPVYYTDMVSNLHAGKEFYLNSLKDNYQVSFSEDFSKVMEEIETEYKEANHLIDLSDVEDSLTTTSGDTLLVRNWQDILAIYIYEESLEGKTEFEFNEDSKEKLAKIFAEMNPVVKSKVNDTRAAYADRHINYYIKKNNIDKENREILKKYVETDCKLLCAVVTGSRGLVRESVGEDVSEERVNVITAAYSLVGKVGYFWGGKSVELGEDPSWGTAEKVTAEGSTSTGTTRAFGLDCSGFVTWAVVNGYQDKGMQGSIGDGTTDQWLKANVVAEADAQPGDLVFQKGPESGSNNHVGILCGKTDAGDWIAVHCSSGKNGVTVGEAYGASFRYIRQPDFYPTEDEIRDMLSIKLEDGVFGDGSTVTFGSYLDSGEISGFLVDNSQVESFDDITITWLTSSDTELDLDGRSSGTVIPVILVDDSIVELF